MNGQAFEFIEKFPDLNDTIYVDQSLNLNTDNIAFNFKLDFYSNPIGKIGSSQDASTIYLDIFETDERLEMSWPHQVPWNNTDYNIYRKDTGSSEYVFLDHTVDTFYVDSNLVNGEEYCYYIESIGSYSAEGLFSPLVNYSQLACGIPVDNVPPCPPGLAIRMDCPLFENILRWNNTIYEDSCDKDIAKYYVYYGSNESTDFSIIDSVLQTMEDSLTYIHKGVTLGCYVVTAIDSMGNQSAYSNMVCTPGCSGYELPNVFTPNGDQRNDYFTPFPESLGGVESIEIFIFNRWGLQVFESTDPLIMWDGRNQQTNKDCPDGTYFYVCEVYEKNLSGLVQRTLQGSVTILR